MPGYFLALLSYDPLPIKTELDLTKNFISRMLSFRNIHTHAHGYMYVIVLLAQFTCWSPLTLWYDGIWRWGLWEVIRFRWGHEGGTLIGDKWFYKKRPERAHSLFFSLCHSLFLSFSLSLTIWRQSKKVSVCKQGSGPSPGTEAAATLISQSPELEK